jgi:hypothetical protein
VEMTREEFYKKYGDVAVSFESYYKYTFSYRASLPDGSALSVGCGGNSDEIYRLEVSKDQQLKVGELQPYTGAVYLNGVEIDSFYDY